MFWLAGDFIDEDSETLARLRQLEPLKGVLYFADVQDSLSISITAPTTRRTHNTIIFAGCLVDSQVSTCSVASKLRHAQSNSAPRTRDPLLAMHVCHPSASENILRRGFFTILRIQAVQYDQEADRRHNVYGPQRAILYTAHGRFGKRW